jgi:lipid-binding SYLF domain-containing protein
MRQFQPAASSAPELTRRGSLTLAAAAAMVALARPGESAAATAQELARNSHLALDRLFALRPQTRAWAKQAKAIIVFPEIIKAGFMFGGQGGDGAMFEKGKVTGFFRTAAASFGLQAGAQKFSYALFLMNQKALDYVKSTDGWSIGTGPSVVLVDEGAAKALTTTTMRKDVYAMVYGQQGLMAGLSLEGSKITKIHPKAA